jgi:hypothetical protein
LILFHYLRKPICNFVPVVLVQIQNPPHYSFGLGPQVGPLLGFPIRARLIIVGPHLLIFFFTLVVQSLIFEAEHFDMLPIFAFDLLTAIILFASYFGIFGLAPP